MTFVVNFVVTTRLLRFAIAEPAGKVLAWQAAGRGRGSNPSLPNIFSVISDMDRHQLRRCEVGVTVGRWCCPTHTGSEVSSCVGGVVEMCGKCGFWLCGCGVVLVGLFVGF